MNIANLQQLIDALRNELQQYGEMLALLDNQQELMRSRAVSNIPGSMAAINDQTAAIQSARAQRETLQRGIAQSVGRGPDSTFSDILPALPAAYRPLVSALVAENNALLRRVRESAQKSQTLLRKTSDDMQQVVTALPGGDTAFRIQTPILLPVQPESTLYEAIA